LVVEGGRPLFGSVAVGGSKNSALPIICASILASSPVSLKNIPRLDDIHCICEVLRSLGASCSFDDDTLTVDATALKTFSASYELVSKMRASFLILGPLVARHGRARVPLPGGCNIGPRPVDEHLRALTELGTTVHLKGGVVEATTNRLKGTYISFNVSSVGATENSLMASVLAEGTTVLDNCAEEPEVEDLVNFLNSLGAEISRIGPRKLEIRGKKELFQKEPYTVIPDRIEAGTYITAICATAGKGRVTNARPEHLTSLLDKLNDINVKVSVEGDTIIVDAQGEITATEIRTQPYPGFPTDLQPQMVALLTQANGVSLVTEGVFPQRFSYVPELNRMGAKIRLTENSAVIEGTPGGLTGAPVHGYDIRGCAALVIGALSAKGKSLVLGYEHLARGYQNLEGKLGSLGANISLVDREFPLQGDNPTASSQS